jgi:iron-sulfur cluster insertion protein
MTAKEEMVLPIYFSDNAAVRVKELMLDEENSEMKLRVYVTGGGCSGFQYGFTFDDKVNEGDRLIPKDGVTLIVDSISLQYLIGGTIDFTSGLDGSRFFVDNPNATATCGCGSSFSL